jgi:hypothetical protein
MSWPSIQPPSYPLDEEVFKPQIRTEFESGHVQSRVRATVGKRRFSLRWTSMPSGDYASLDAAFLADQGTTFSWSHPLTGTAYTVRYSKDQIKSSILPNGRRRVEVELEEAP